MTNSMVRSQNLAGIDPGYVPAAGDEAAVFDEIKKFIHTALTLCVHETTGVTIVWVSNKR